MKSHRKNVKRWMVAAAWVGCMSAQSGTWDDAQVAFTELDDRRAMALLRQAAQEGDARAQRALGLALQQGQRLFPGVLTADPAESAHWLTLAAAQSLSVPESRVPQKKRTRAGLYMAPWQAQAIKDREGRAVLFLDIRTRAEAAYVGMPSSADALVPYLVHDEFMSDWDRERSTFRASANGHFADDVARALTAQGLSREATVVLICRSGDRSARAADLLTELGYSRVYSVVEGFEGDLSAQGRRDINGWKNDMLPWSYRLDMTKALFSQR